MGTLAVLLGGVLLFRVDNSPYGTTSFWLVLAIAGSLGLISMFVISRIWSARRLPARGPGVSMVGEHATVVTRLDPHGQVLVHGERWQAELAARQCRAGRARAHHRAAQAHARSRARACRRDGRAARADVERRRMPV